jgi:hypothetical protein
MQPHSFAVLYNRIIPYTVLLTAMSYSDPLFDDDDGYYSGGSNMTEDLDPEIAAERQDEVKVLAEPELAYDVSNLRSRDTFIC